MTADNPACVLYISYDGMTDPLGQSQVIPYLKALSQYGYRFTLLSFEKEQRYKKYAAEIKRLLAESNIAWVPLTYTKKPPVLSTLWDVFRMKQKAFALHRAQKFSAVHCRGYIAALAGEALQQQAGVKFIFDMRGFYADERVDGSIWRLSNPVYRAVYHYFKRKEKEFLSKADYVISLTEKGKEIIHSWKEIAGQPLPIEVIPCCADLDFFHPENVDQEFAAQLKSKWHLTEKKFVLTYLGSIGTWYMLPEMLRFFAALLRQKPEAKFLLITTDLPETIWAEAAKIGIPRESLLITPASRKEVPAYLSLSDWAIFFIKPVFSKSASSPTKQGELMGMGIPLICNGGVGDVERIMHENPQAGIVIPLTEEDYRNGVCQMLSFEVNRSAIRAAAAGIYSLQLGVERYRSVYQKVLA